MLGVLVGEHLGGGVTRSTYALRNSDCVVKVETNNQFNNIMEWEVWNASKDTSLRQWLAPCLSISKDGRALVQKRTYPLYNFPLPELIPAHFCDFKVQNYGLFEGRLVCHDYGDNYALELGCKSKKMKKVRWWDGATSERLDDKTIVT